MEYPISYLRQIASKSFKNSFNFLGLGSQIVIDLVLWLYLRRTPASQMGDFMLGVSIAAGVFFAIFLVYLLWEFRWATPDIKITPRRQLVENVNLMVMFDIQNREMEPLKDCYLKLNKFVVFFLDESPSERTSEDHYLERFLWQSGDEHVEIPSLEVRTVNIARENPTLADAQKRQLYGPVKGAQDAMPEQNLFLGLCTNFNHIIFPREDTKAAIFVAHLKFEAELRGMLGERRIFPRKIYGDVVFKKTGGLEFHNGKPVAVRPTTWLDLEKIKPWQMRKP